MPQYQPRYNKRPYNTKYRQSGGFRNTNRNRGQYIDPSKFVRTAKPIRIDEYENKFSFTDFEIEKLLKDNVVNKYSDTPTPIQDQTIPHGLDGKDIIGIANTGTGKTAAFAIPLLNKLMKDRSSRALIVAPTRELAQQIEDECRALGKNSGIFGALLIGGTPMGPQLRDLSSNPNIVIGTPGRIKDHIERRTLKLASFNFVVLDEVDRMLDMGFINDVREILSNLSSNRQSLFFSATLDSKVRTLIETFSKDPIMVSVQTEGASENVNQGIVRFSSDHEKIDKLHDILIKAEVEKILVFADTQRNTEKLSKILIDRGFKADAIHGGKSQGQRQRALNRFKKNEIKVLVATDVAARGIDVDNITHVINYTKPQSYEDYIHRIGRAGRAGRVGHALTFLND